MEGALVIVALGATLAAIGNLATSLRVSALERRVKALEGEGPPKPEAR